MRRHLVIGALAGLTLLLAAIAGGAGWLLATASGLDAALALLARLPGIELRAVGTRGSLAGGFEIERLSIDHERVRVEVEGLRTRVSLGGLALAVIDVPYLDARRAVIAVKPRLKPPDRRPVVFLPGPLRLHVAALRVAGLEVRTPGGGRVAMAALTAEARLSRTRLAAEALGVRGAGWQLGGVATLAAGDSLGLAGSLLLRIGPDAAVSATVDLAGTLAALEVRARSTAPAGATFVGRMALEPLPAASGRLTLDGFDLAALGAGRIPGAIGGQLELNGWIEAFTARGGLRATGLPLGEVDLSLAAGLAGRTLGIRDLRASLAAAGGRTPRLLAAGTIEIGAAPRLALAGRWSDLRWPLGPGVATVESPDGSFELHGGTELEYRIAASTRAAGLVAARIRTRGRLGRAALTVDALEADLLRGHATGRGRLEFAAAPHWQFAVAGRELDPAELRASLAGRLTMRLSGAGDGWPPGGRMALSLERLDGTVRGLPARGRGRLALAAGEWHADALELECGSAALKVDGKVGRQNSLEWRLRVDRLGDFLAGASGSVRSRGSLAGDRDHLKVTATVGARTLGYGAWRVAQLTADAALDGSDRGPSRLKITALGVGRGVQSAERLEVTLDGRASAHALAIRATRGGDSAELTTHGEYRTGIWALHFDALAIAGPPLWAYRLAAPATLVADHGTLTLGSTCLERDASRICAAGTWSSRKPWSFSAEARELPLRLAALKLPKDTEYGGTVHLSAAVHGEPDHPWTGAAAAELAGAEFRYRAPSGRIEVVRLGNGRIEVHSTATSHVASLGLATVAGTYVTGSASLGRTAAAADAPLAGQVTLSTAELAWLPLFADGVDRVSGQLKAELTIGGTPAAALLAGRAHLGGGEIDIYRTNLLLRAVEASVALEGDSLSLAATASTRGGNASASGRIEWRGRQPTGVLDFKGENLLVADLPEVRVVASPALKFSVAGKRLGVSGEVRIPTARIAPRDLRNAVLASRDERRVGDAGPSAVGQLAVDTSVRLLLGDDVAIDAYGLKATLGGSLLVTARGGEVAAASGELRVLKGKYTAYTRELDIDRGRLLFAGQALGNPGLDIRAQRKLPTITAGINVRGTLLEPQISFYSEPPLSQSQIAAVLIVGKTLDDIQDSDKTAIGGADTRSALIAQGSALLAGQLGRYVGVDDVGVEEGTNRSTSVVIGKFLSPRLYVSYGVSLTEAINTLKLRYTIGDRWVIRTESGAAQSADIEYTIEH